ncbi:NAD-dependent succinate-semialdehyde dehydrogenase [Enterococcus mediterraneensis]|uniref:NAD-dependent succinate-semialdehyde dehydrogenase n=1 Tax=Enterococcus mediterraneensis TaxID=2364791 RepID=UPI000F05CCF6|nr:NAD-dependent succinate-semialdehyde dehydrogenase [Enterococcus mediterraneensis]
MIQKMSQVPTQLFIDGKWVDGGQEAVPVKNPANGETLAEVSQGAEEETQQAIAAAKRAFPLWSKKAPSERAQLMNKIADMIEEEADRLATIMTLEQGKPLKESRAEVLTDVENFRWNAAEGQRIYGEIVPAPYDHHWLVRKQAVGVVAAITPWNFPSNMIARKIAPALAAGCTLVMKPSKETPLSALALVDIFDRAGMPEGVVNIVLGSSKVIGKVLTDSDDVRKLTFTGSTKTGQLLYEQCAATLKHISLELGGHAPFIVFEDADIPSAAENLLAAKFRNNGQVCTAPNRIFLHKTIKEEFTQVLLDKISSITVGNGLDDPDIGPVINEDGLKKIEEQLEDASNKGARVLYGGSRLTKRPYADGTFFEPTILDGVTNDMQIYYEETFGPVIPLIEFTDVDEVIAAANDTEFGLASYFFSQDLQTISKVARELDYGMVGVNEMAISNPAVPFGGVKHSGFGRENGKYGVEEYIDVKFIDINTQLEK